MTKIAIKVMGIVSVVIGGLAILEAAANNVDSPVATLIGGSLFLALGILNLVSLKSINQS